MKQETVTVNGVAPYKIDWEDLYIKNGIRGQDDRSKLLFRKGYKANKAKWTDEDMRKCWDASHKSTYTNCVGHNNAKDDSNLSFSEFLQSLNKKNKPC